MIEPISPRSSVGVYFTILTKYLRDSVAFYTEVFGFTVAEEREWRVILTLSDSPGVHLVLLSEQSEFTPRQAFGMPSGAILTLMVDDLDATVARAVSAGAAIIMDGVPLDYGVTRALLRDPTGFVLDLSTPTAALSANEAARHPPRDSIQQPVGRGFDPHGQQ